LENLEKILTLLAVTMPAMAGFLSWHVPGCNLMLNCKFDGFISNISNIVNMAQGLKVKGFLHKSHIWFNGSVFFVF
jgi:hypothetical protein